MNKEPDIVKAGAIIINDKKELLLVETPKQEVLIMIGGRTEAGESLEECLKRELEEELQIKNIKMIQKYNVAPVKPAAGDPEKTVQIHTYLVETDDIPIPSAEVKNIHWISKEEYENHPEEISLIPRNFVIPKLIEDGLL
ncbi:NUDIX domain-containing protein [Candidatus Dojkabacteria bacterium]|nr:NUDIX domain-containing protein [Candidatus Dojkabacteria bacterium]